MHKCLTIPELLDYIAQWLSFDRTDKLNTALFEGGLIPPSTTPSDATPHSLLSFASTCRAFYEPSMNVIWHTLFSLKPLVKCFPRHVWQEVDHAVTIVKPPADGEWDVVLRNAQRVRCVHFDVNGGLSKDALEILASQLRQPHLFPQVKNIQVTLDDAIITYATLLIGPLLEAVSIQNGTDETILALLEKIRDIAGPMLSISIGNVETSTPAIDRALETVILRSRHLQHLARKSHFIPTSTFAHLASMSSLWKLAFYIEDGYCLTKAIDPTISNPFAELKILTLGIDDLQSSCLVALLQAMKAPRLSQISIGWILRPSTQELSSLCEALSSHRILETIFIYMQQGEEESDDDDDLNEAESIGITTLRPLLRLPLLRDVTVSNIPVRLSSGDILDIARALSNLRLLNLEPKGVQVPANPPKFKELIHFVEHCPKLEALCLWVDAANVDMDEGRPGKGLVLQTMKLFSPGYSPISDATSVAAFLSDVFPDIIIDRRRGQQQDFDAIQKWDFVHTLVWRFAAIRKQERSVQDVVST